MVWWPVERTKDRTGDDSPAETGGQRAGHRGA
jgi:hypothetical protein